jgi:4-hydroxythreonine-4-phosphate dehydrogenase
MTGLPAIAVAIGDPNGIWPELAVKAAAAILDQDSAHLVLVDDEFVVRSVLRQFAPQLEGGMAVKQRGSDVALSLLPVPSLSQTAFRPGAIDAEAGRARVACASAAIARMGFPPSEFHADPFVPPGNIAGT